MPTNARSCLPAPSPAPPCAPAEPLASCPALPPPAPSLCLSIFFLSAMTEMQPSALKAVFPLRQAHLRRSRRPAASPHPNPCRAPSSSTWAAQPVGTGSTDAFALSRARRRGFGAFKHWVNRWVNRRFCPLMPPRPYGAFKRAGQPRVSQAVFCCIEPCVFTQPPSRGQLRPTQLRAPCLPTQLRAPCVPCLWRHLCSIGPHGFVLKNFNSMRNVH